MIDDRQTCDVCGEEFNEDRPHVDHAKQVAQKNKKEDADDSIAKLVSEGDIQAH